MVSPVTNGMTGPLVEVHIRVPVPLQVTITELPSGIEIRLDSGIAVATELTVAVSWSLAAKINK